MMGLTSCCGFKKPNDATLTIEENSSSVGTFTADASVDKSVNITVPVSVSELNNDSGYLTTESDVIKILQTNRVTYEEI